MVSSERGGWKSAHRGNSLAAYSTSRTVLEPLRPVLPKLGDTKRMGGEGEHITFHNLMDAWVRTVIQLPPQWCTGEAPPSGRRLTTDGLGPARGVKQEDPEPDGRVL
jgi:hypothetical protein